MLSLVRRLSLLTIIMALSAFEANAQLHDRELAGAAPTRATASQPVRVLVGFNAGSGPDVLARTVATQLSIEIGRQFYVENQSGANGTLAIANLVKSEPTGGTLLYSSSSIAPVPYIYKSLRYDIQRDLTPIATVGVLDGLLILVHPATPVHDIAGLVAYAKANRLVYGSPGVGNSLHLATEMFNLKAGVTMDHVPFRGAGDVTTALLSQSIQVMLVTPPSVVELVRGGQLRAIGYTGSKPFAEFATLALVKDVIPGFPAIGSWGMFFAPTGTPPAVIEMLNEAIRRALRVPAVAKVVGAAGYVPDERSAGETASFFAHEVEAAGEAVAAAKIKPN